MAPCRLLRCLFPYYMLFLFILPSVSLSQPRTNISSSSSGGLVSVGSRLCPEPCLVRNTYSINMCLNEGAD